MNKVQEERYRNAALAVLRDEFGGRMGPRVIREAVREGHLRELILEHRNGERTDQILETIERRCG